MAVDFTGQQLDVIEAPLSNILVSAAAGSGKTTVMVERIVRRIVAREVTVSQLLVLTFTDAAAANMKRKIVSALHQAAATTEDPEARRYLKNQEMALPYARISTIHSFCLSLVRSYGYLITPEEDNMPTPPVHPAVADETFSGELLQQAIGEILDKRYSDEPDPDFMAYLEGYGDARGDESVREQLTRSYHQLRTIPHYRSWLSGQPALLQETARDFDASPAARRLKDQLRGMLAAVERYEDEALALCHDPDTLLRAAPKNVETRAANEEASRAVMARTEGMIRALAGLRQDLEQAPDLSWNEIHERGRSIFSPEELKGSSGTRQKRALQKLIREWDGIVIMLNEQGISGRKPDPKWTRIKPVFHMTAEAVGADITLVLPAMRGFCSLIADVDERAQLLRTRREVVDFDDFEHIALCLLDKEPVREMLRREIREIYIDEYQDTSSIQNTILDRLSDDNSFVVGDVKQSIYRFRHARPELFLERAGRYRRDSAEGVYLTLPTNFRSVPGILTFCNEIFGLTMTAAVSGIDYHDGHALGIPDKTDEPPGAAPVELWLIPSKRQEDAEEDETKEQPGPVRRQASLIARAIICQMRECTAPPYEEIAVLCRTNAQVDQVSEVLAACGLPVQSEGEEGYLDTFELRLLEAVFQLLANSSRDLPLLTCLRQLPVIGQFSDVELVEIAASARTADAPLGRNSHYHQAFTLYRDEGPAGPLQDKVRRFSTWVHELRLKERYLSLEELVDEIDHSCALSSHLAAMDGGSRRLMNLREFRSWAAAFEARGQHGVTYFADYLKQRRESGSDKPAFRLQSDVVEAVNVLTLHKSKGLEFDSVYLIGLDRRTGGQGSRNLILLDEDDGLAMTIALPGTRIRMPGQLRQSRELLQEQSGWTEDLCLLYVAMTRARKALYLLVSADPDSATVRDDWDAWFAAASPGTELPDSTLYQLKRPDQLILCALGRQGYPNPLDHGFDGATTGEAFTLLYEQAPLRVIKADPWAPELEADPSEVQQQEGSALIVPGRLNRDNLRALRAHYTEPYRFRGAAETALKYSVSEVKRLAYEQGQAQDEGMLEDGNRLADDRPVGINLDLSDWDTACFLQGEDETKPLQAAPLHGSERGTLLHWALRFLDPASGEAADEQLAELADRAGLDDTARRTLSEAEPLLAAWLDSDLAGRVAGAQTRRQVWRELPFTMAVPAASFFPEREGLNDEPVLIQGMIDLWYRDEEGRAVIVDYKSDRIPGTDEEVAEELRRRYGLQLELYADAVAAASGTTVRKRLIWMLERRRAFSI